MANLVKQMLNRSTEIILPKKRKSPSKYTLVEEYVNLSSDKLVLLCQQQDLAAFNVLISRYEKAVLNLAMRYLRDYHLALEESQEIFIKLFTKIKDFRREASFSTWWYRIAVNHCLNVITKKKRHSSGGKKTVSLESVLENKQHSDLKDNRQISPEQILAKRESSDIIWQAIQALPQDQTQVIILYHYEKLKYEEIAEIMGVPVTTVCACLYRARKKLKRKLLLGGRPSHG